MFKDIKDFKREILRLRSARKLHSLVEEEIGRLLRTHFPTLFVIPETTKISIGHRADIVANLKDGRKIHFEIFADPSTVSNGVDSLDISNADFCIAIILDEDVDKRIADKYYDQLSHKGISRPCWYTLKLSDILVSTKQHTFIECIRQIIQEEGIRKRLSLNELRLPAEEWYVSREENEKEIAGIFRILRKARVPDVFVTGNRGIGKSSFLNWIENAAMKRSFVVIKRRVINEDWSQLILELIKDVQEKLSFFPKYKSVAVVEMLVESVRNLEKNHKPIVFLIDQFERLFEKGEIRITKAEMNRVWRSFINLTAQFKDTERILWVIAARKQYYFLLFPRYGTLEECNFRYVCVSDFSRSESRRLLTKISNLTGYSLTEKAKKMLIDNCGRNPQITILSLINLFGEATFDNAVVDESKLLKMKPWLDVFEKDLERLQSDIERLVVYAMAHAQTEFCSFKHIMSKVTTEFEISEYELRDVLRHLQSDLLLIKQPKRDVFEFYHPRFADYVKKKREADFPEEWTVGNLIDSAVYLLRRLGSERSDLTDFEVAADFFAEAIFCSPEYRQTLDKVIDLFVEQSAEKQIESFAELFDISMISVSEAEGLKRQLGYNNASIFLRRVLDFYKSYTEDESDEEVVNWLKDQILTTCEKCGLAGPWLSQNIEYLCVDADIFREELNDFKRAKKLVNIAVKLLNEAISRLKEGECFSVSSSCGDIILSFGFEQEAKKIYEQIYLSAKIKEQEAEKQRNVEKKADLLRSAALEMHSIGKKEEARNLLRRSVELLKRYLESIKSNRNMIEKAEQIESEIERTLGICDSLKLAIRFDSHSS